MNNVRIAKLSLVNAKGASKMLNAKSVPAMRYSVLTLPTKGIKKNPAAKVPTMLPTVESA